MARKAAFRVAVAAAAVLAWSAVAAPTQALASPLSLVVSQSTGFAILGHWCGGISQNDFGTSFDAASGYPDGDVYLWTICSSGKGTHTTYSAWIATTWDFTATLVSYSVLTSAPSVNPSLSVYDSHGNQLYNDQLNHAFLNLATGFVPAPRVSGVTPSSAPQGSTVTITGTSFTGATSVSFGKTAATSFTVNSDTSITAVAPAVRTGTGDVTVNGPGGLSATNPSDRFTFVLTPRVAAIRPSQGSADGGTVVVIHGNNFTGTNSVRFGGLPAHFTVISPWKIRATSPTIADPVAVDITVTNSHGTSALTTADRFTYTD